MSRHDLPAELGEPHPSLALAADYVAPTHLELEVDGREIAAERQDLEPDPTAAAEPEDEPPGTRSGATVLIGA